MVKILYIITKSIYSMNDQQTLLNIMMKQKTSGNSVGLLLLQDSTTACWKNGKNILKDLITKGIDVYALKEDLLARGISKENANPQVKEVNYDESISLMMEKYEKVVTWC